MKGSYASASSVCHFCFSDMAVLTRWAKGDFNLEEQDSDRKARRQSRGRLIGRHTLANGKAFG